MNTEPPPSLDLSLNGFVSLLKDAEERYRYWITTANDLETSNAELSQSLATQQTLNATHESELSSITNDYHILQSVHNALVGTKVDLESNITDLTNTVKTASDMIGTTLKQLNKLENENNALKARVEMLEFDLAASDALADALEVELVRLNSESAHNFDPPKVASEENERQVVQLKDLNIGENSSISSAEQIQSLQASIERLERRYDRLVTKKEAAEQKFYASYVEWQNFKGWWAGFSKFPGISRRILVYNRDVKSGAWIPGGGKGIAAGGKGRVLRVIEAAEQDPKAFPNVEEPEEDVLMETDEKHPPGQELEDPKVKLERVLREAREICKPPTSLATPVDVEPALDQTPADNGNVTPVAPAQIPEADEAGARAHASDDSFDPDKTQETTPAKSQAQAFEMDLSGLKYPRIALCTPANRPILETPRLLSSEPSQVIVIKDESPDPDNLLRPTTTTPTPVASTSKPPLATTIKSAKPKTTPTLSTTEPTAFPRSKLIAPLSSVPPSTLGKRKSPMEDQTPRMEGGRRTNRVELQLQYMDGTIVPTNSSMKKRRGLDDGDGMEPPSARAVTGKWKSVVNEGIESHGQKSDKASTTLNGLYEINPTRNGGLNFAFDEVVRKKDERRKMDAGTCADCIEYYKAVGPMPPRAQAPLWRSPTSSQEVAKNTRTSCKCKPGNDRGGEGDGDEDAGDAAVAAHQQQISRHRHHFPAAETPPMYWDLGFPNTQQVKEIKETAERMHERKERGMEMEARKPDGKYRRR